MDNETSKEDTKTMIWKRIRAAGDYGISRKQLIEESGKSGTSVDWHLTNLFRDAYIQRPSGFRTHGMWCAGPQIPQTAGLLLELALELLDDCPAGVAESVLCSSLRCSAKTLSTVLGPAESTGRVQRMQMPDGHGGGLGWFAPDPAAQGEPPPQRLTSIDLAHPDVRMLPVVEVDIDRIHRIHQEQRGEPFAASLDGGRLSITSGAMSFTLSQAHTSNLLHYLRAEVPS